MEATAVVPEGRISPQDAVRPLSFRIFDTILPMTWAGTDVATII